MKSARTSTKPATASVRCAIYTRKSTDEGLEQEFNSLDAQREAGEAYIKSQAGEGWSYLPDRYDDGGFTGGNMDRPALRRLLADIEAGKVDCVIVYKVDRLSRSLLDFARLMETFEKHRVSFVSVTQLFNTATSMGRLILNVLLSFAQFEREIIGERKEPVIDPLEFGTGAKKKKLFVTADGKVWLRAGPDMELIPWLEKKVAAGGAEGTKAKAALDVAKPLGNGAKKVATEAANANKKGPAKVVQTTKKKADEDQGKLPALLEKLSLGCPVRGTGSCVKAGSGVTNGQGQPTPIEGYQPLAAVQAVQPGDGASVPRAEVSPDEWSGHRVYRLVFGDDPRDVVEAELVRPVGWLDYQRVDAFGRVWVSLKKEGGVEGWAEVLGVEGCPAVDRLPAGCRRVTGTFRHSRGRLLELRIEGEREVLGVLVQREMELAGAAGL